jgi:nitrogen fixation protein FixH
MSSKTGTPFNPWPISIIAFFSVAILGCGTFVAFCSRHPADLISANYYEDEVRYQGQMERIHRAQQPDQTASVGLDAAGKQITVALPMHPSAAKPEGKIQLYRPSAANLDRQLPLNVNATGTQVIDAASLAPGLWKVRVRWSVGDRDYFIDQKILIPPGQAIDQKH